MDTYFHGKTVKKSKGQTKFQAGSHLRRGGIEEGGCWHAGASGSAGVGRVGGWAPSAQVSHGTSLSMYMCILHTLAYFTSESNTQSKYIIIWKLKRTLRN